jgi:tRNA dimethylallyltransferase
VSLVDPEHVARLVEIARAAPERLLCVLGPTASGKSDLALAVAGALDGEIISADSVQIYRGFDIGSGKPAAADLARVPHHLLGTHDPLAAIDAPEWARLAEAAIEDARARGRVPIVCGGTFFWIRALVLGLVAAPSADAAIRARHRELAGREGRAALHAELARIDPPSAARLHPNDLLRVSRALEVHELSGRTMSEWQAEHGFRTRRFDAAFVAIHHSPEALTARIRTRVSGMLAAGWLAETQALLEAGYGEARAMSSVGYAEVRAHLEGRLATADLEESIVRATRTFARRQRTWLRDADVLWLGR